MTRKNLFSAILGAAIALSPVSCSKESAVDKDSLNIIDGELISFPATLDEEYLTKAYTVGTNGSTSGKVYWEDGDRIMVSSGGSNTQVFEYNSTKKIFEHTEANGVKDNGIGFVMIYPADIFTDADFAGNTFTVHVNLPAVQTFRDHNSCNKPPMMANCAPIAAGNRGTVQFKSICGILGFPVTGDIDKGDFASVSFKGAGACGAGTLTCSGGAGSSLVPNLTMSDPSTEKTVTISDTGTTSESTSVWYYMYLPPKTYSSAEVSVTFANSKAEVVDRTVTSLSISRNNISWAADYFQTLFSGGGTDGAQSGTESNPYLIYSGDDLIELAAKVNSTNATYSSAVAGPSSADTNHPAASPSKSGVNYDSTGKYFKLMADINMSAFNSNFAPIGLDSDHAFKGTFDGNGHTISNLSLSKSTSIVGLFGYVNGGTVKNLTLSNTSITSTLASGDAKAGAFIGQMTDSSTLENCKISGSLSVTLAANAGGGFVGMMSSSTINNCDYVSTSGTPAINGSTTGTRVGGIVGAVYGTSAISGCDAFANVTAMRYAGGVVGIVGDPGAGKSPTVISNCNFVPNAPSSDATNRIVTSRDGSTGGIAGHLTSHATVQNCVSRGRVVTSGNGDFTGGIVGYASIQSDSTIVNIISNCQYHSTASYGYVTSGGSHVGGIVGCIEGAGQVNDCTADGNAVISSTGYGKGRVGGIAGELKNTSVVSGCSSSVSVSCIADNFDSGSQGGCFAGGIVGKMGSRNSNVGARITGCTVNNAGQTIAAARHIGGVVGFIHSTAENAVYDCTVNAGVTIKSQTTGRTSLSSWLDKNSCAGGIAGAQWGDTDVVYCCTKTCAVQGFAGIGGITGCLYGHNDFPLIDKCSSMANVSAYDENINRIGGIAGYCDNACLIRNSVRCGGTIACNYNSDATGIAGVGGILGHEYNESIWGAGGTARIHNCQVNSTLVTLNEGCGGGVGGLIGIVTTGSSCECINCYVPMGRVSYSSWLFVVRVGATYLDNMTNFTTYCTGPVFGYNTGGLYTIKRCFWGTNYIPGNLTTSGKITISDIYDGVTTGDGGYGTNAFTDVYKTDYANYGTGRTFLPTLTRSYTTSRTIVAHLNYATGKPAGANDWSTSNAWGGTNGYSQKLASPNGVKY